MWRVAQEAVRNSLRHADATTLSVTVERVPEGHRLVVRDDGRGVTADVLRSGSDGHWGLPGMRERADRIGAQFRVWSSAGAGTEIELIVPGRIAFAQEKES